MKTNNIRMTRKTNTELFNVIAKSDNKELAYNEPLNFADAKRILLASKGEELTPGNWVEHTTPASGSDAKALAQYEAYAR